MIRMVRVTERSLTRLVRRKSALALVRAALMAPVMPGAWAVIRSSGTDRLTAAT